MENDQNVPPVGSKTGTEEQLKLQTKVQSGANWFFWIAAVSIIIPFGALLSVDWGLFLFHNSYKTTPVSVFAWLISNGVLISLGVLAGKRHNWAFIAGIVLYAVDGFWWVLFLGSIGFFPLPFPALRYYAVGLAEFGFHVWALFRISGGLFANMELDSLLKAQQAVNERNGGRR